jgi:AcrR family transcriptional regulator
MDMKTDKNVKLHGKRAANKQQKLTAIARAARHVFSKQGYDAAKIADIAKLAGVASGTVFLHADNKRDLIYLAMREDFQAALADSEGVHRAGPVVEQLMQIFLPFLFLYSREPELGKIMLSEFLFFVGKQSREYDDFIDRIKLNIARRIEAAQIEGTVLPLASPEEIAEFIWFIHQGNLRQWVGKGAEDVTQALSSLRRAVRLSLHGLLSPSQAAR